MTYPTKVYLIFLTSGAFFFCILLVSLGDAAFETAAVCSVFAVVHLTLGFIFLALSSAAKKGLLFGHVASSGKVLIPLGHEEFEARAKSYLSGVTIMGFSVGLLFVLFLFIAFAQKIHLLATVSIVFSIVFLNIGFYSMILLRLVKLKLLPFTSENQKVD